MHDIKQPSLNGQISEICSHIIYGLNVLWPIVLRSFLSIWTIGVDVKIIVIDFAIQCTPRKIAQKWIFTSQTLRLRLKAFTAHSMESIVNQSFFVANGTLDFIVFQLI